MQALTALSSTAIMNEAHAQGPDSWEPFKQWFETNTRNQLQMRGKDFRDMINNPSLNFHYDPDANELKWNNPEDTYQRPLPGPITTKTVGSAVAPLAPYPELSVARQANNLLRNLNTMYSTEGSDGKSQITRQMQSMGIPVLQKKT
jgi:hypothetical protein